VFITKYRKPVLRGDIAQEVRRLTREVCRGLDIEIVQGHVRPDYVHLLLDVPPAPQETKGLRGGDLRYAAQGNPQVDAKIAENRRFWTGTGKELVAQRSAASFGFRGGPFSLHFRPVL